MQPPSRDTSPQDADALRREVKELRELLATYRANESTARDTALRLRALVDNAPVVLFALDSEGRFTLSEGRGLEPLGLVPGQVVGLSAYDVYRDAPQVIDQLDRSLAGDPVNEIVTVNGRIFESLYTPRIDPDGRVAGVDGLAWDVTARYQAEESARALETQLLQAQKIETIGTLAGGIAHDFNNILSPILGYTDIAMDQLEEGHPAREDLRQVLNAAGRARELVQQILIFARGGDQQKRPVQMHLVVQEALKLIRATLPTTIEISQRVVNRDDVVMADAGQMHQVIMNLCTNAAHAMRENGGVLRIELEQTRLHAPGITGHPAFPAGNYVVLTVQDHGEGMRADVLARAFEPFFTTKPSGEGTGLGLAVVHGIVHSHGGAIAVESRPAHGSTFRVFLPAAGKTVPAPDAEPGRGAVGRGEHILVVDDEVEITRMLKRMLESRGFRVTAFVSSEQALRAFRQDPSQFDALISDQTMPRLTGLALAKTIRIENRILPIIITTGFGEKLAVDDASKDVTAFAAKPFDASTLTALLRRVLDEAGSSPA
ncbi:MAG TPA: ATP-binding protein [Candidatus Krumholzibacteria bacterium]|nr:ATP-binding protein [Candidatus Krumholzibacteria bacterium]